MDPKKSDVLFVVLLLVAVAGTAIASQLYDAYLESKQKDVFTVVDYLTIASRSPESYLIVTGKLATQPELDAAQALSTRLGVNVEQEEFVIARSSLILVGNPGTHLLLDRLMTGEYDPSAASVTISGDNLLVIISSPEQAQRAVEVLGNFNDEPVLLSPSASLGFQKTSALALLLAILTVPALLVFLEGHRKHVIAQATESTDEHKLAAIAAYIRKYEDQGYSEPQIRSWLEKFGYAGELVDIAMRRA